MSDRSTSTKRDINTTSENKRLLYRFLHENGPASKQTILMGTGLSLPTITQGIRSLSDQGLLGVSDSVRNTGGRNAAAYTCIPEGRYAVGLFFSANHITAVAVDIMGNVRCEKRIREKADLHDEQYLLKLGNIAEETVRDSGIPEKALIGVGLAVQSLVSEDGEYIEHGMAHDFSGISRTVLAKHIPYPSRLFHDSFAAGFAEVWSRPNLKNAFYLSLNSVVGGALITNGRILFPGDNNRAGEIGHILVDPHHGSMCYCGNRGCFDTVCRSSVLESLTDGDLEAFFKLLDEGNEEAVRRFDKYLDDLAIAVHNIRMFLDSPIIIGGYVGSLMGHHIEELWRKVDEHMIFGAPASSYVFPCIFRREVMAAGAAILLLEDFIESL